MKKISIILLVIFLYAPVFSQDEKQEKAKEYVKKNVDGSFYEKHISFNEKWSKDNMMIFNFIVHKKPTVNKLIVIHFNKSSEIETEYSPVNIKQLKNCIKNPDKCDLPIDENRAIEIAKREGLQEGVKKWDIGFVLWAENKNDYRWTIRNTKYESPVGEEGTYYAEGETIIIKARTGEAKHSFWQSME